MKYVFASIHSYVGKFAPRLSIKTSFREFRPAVFRPYLILDFSSSFTDAPVNDFLLHYEPAEQHRRIKRDASNYGLNDTTLRITVSTPNR